MNIHMELIYINKNKTYAVKGSAAYAGASRISDDWYWIQVWFEKAEYVNMMKHYLKLLEHSAQFRVFWRIVYYKYRKESYVQKPEDEDVPMPVGYSLKKVGDFEFKVSYPEEYLELAEEAERRGKKYIKLSNDKIEIIYSKDDQIDEDILSSDENLFETAKYEGSMLPKANSIKNNKHIDSCLSNKQQDNNSQYEEVISDESLSYQSFSDGKIYLKNFFQQFL